MFCENAYYPNGDEKKRLYCKSELKASKDAFTKNKCPLVYYCAVTERFENTKDMFGCVYRKNDR